MIFPFDCFNANVVSVDVKGKFVDAVADLQIVFPSPSNTGDIKPGIIVRYLNICCARHMCAEVKDPWTGKSGLFSWDFIKDEPKLLGTFT